MPTSVDADIVEQRILEAAYVLPTIGGVTGWGALRWCGAHWFDGRSPDGQTALEVDLATCYQDIRNQRGYRVWQERLGPEELVEIDGIRLTLPVRSVLFLMRYARSLREAVVCFDMAAYADLVSRSEVTAYALSHPGWTGIPQARRALLYVSENSWSPWETRLRLVWVLDAGLPIPLSNQPVFDRQGRLLGTPDLLDLESGTVGEYEGSLHLAGAQRARDEQREEMFRDHGLEPFHIFASDMADRWKVVERMHAARARARWEAPDRRSWTVEPPAWWRQTHSVDLRRRLDAHTRGRLLRHRRTAS